MKSKLAAILLAILLIITAGCQAPAGESSSEAASNAGAPRGGYRAIAYVTVPASENWRWIGTESGDKAISNVDVNYVTHINFAFGMIKAYQFDPAALGRPLMEGEVASSEAYKDPTDGKYHYKATVDGWIEEMHNEVHGGKYLAALVDLKQKKPDLKVLLSIGGWDSDGFCYMAKTEEGRSEFIDSLIDLVNEYGLDGIDIDWEFPTNGGWGAIASCATCVADAKALLTECRTAFDKEFSERKLLTVASSLGQPWVDRTAFAALDYMNVMCYDYDSSDANLDQADLDTASQGMLYNLSFVGDTAANRKKLNLGVPFYNWAGPNLVPYWKPWNGVISTSSEILKTKMEWVRTEGYGGAFYWAYSMDKFEQDVSDANDPEVKLLQRTVYENLNGEG
ncbi:MAG: hypothetical protein LBS74_10115 [Oscillospiraceae bacterium]|jgi:GH18 family chitinase|nr:hypothetical protein [Oscillospiraceae bacterium]